MGGWNSRAGVLDFDACSGQVNDRTNQHHSAGAVIADGIIDEVCQQFTNQHAVAGDQGRFVTPIELDVDVAREGLWWAPVEMVTNAMPRNVTRPRHARKPYRIVNDT